MAATETATKTKSFLFTPDPYHVPGYDGYCPQYKFQVGRTFGRTTMKLFRDPNVTTSGNLVLVRLDSQDDQGANIAEKRAQLVKTRTHSWGDQKFVETMVPGYKGFVPKSQHYFGKRFAEDCFNAISDFENDQRFNNQRKQNLQVIDALQSGRKVTGVSLPAIHTKHTTPLKKIAHEAPAFVSRSAPRYPESPYNMDNADPNKHFISGYNGFVPRSQGLVGKGYPLISHDALNEFTDDLRGFYARRLHPVNASIVYPKCSGVVPHYTGHVPGQKFRHGRTFGRSTVDAKRTKAEAAAAF